MHTKRLTCRFRGLRANNTPCRRQFCPKRRPHRPRPPIVGVCRRGGLRFGRHAAPNRDLTAPNLDLTATKRGNCSIRAATRRRHAGRMLLMVQNPHHYPWCPAPSLVQDCPVRCWLNAMARHLQPQAIQARERAQVRAIRGSSGHVEVFQMDGVGTSIIERPRPLHNHDTPNPAQHPNTPTPSHAKSR